MTSAPETTDRIAPVPFTLTPAAHAAVLPPADIHTWFGLSYANYLVLPRTLLQSMPVWWQYQFTTLLDDLEAAFAHVPQAPAYQVAAAEEREVSDLTPAELEAVGITADGPRCRMTHDHDEFDGADCLPGVTWHDTLDGRQLDPWERVLVPVTDPVPAYNRGRSRVESQAGDDTGELFDAEPYRRYPR